MRSRSCTDRSASKLHKSTSLAHMATCGRVNALFCTRRTTTPPHGRSSPMHSRTIALTALFVLLNCMPASADEPRTPLSLMDAVKVALQHNPGYLASGSDVDAARARVRAARGTVGPTFTISDTYGLVDPVATLQTPSGALPFAPNSTNMPVATLGYTLADGGRMAARISQADAYFAASQAVRRAAASSTIGRVSAAYFDLAAALGSANVAERSVTVRRSARCTRARTAFVGHRRARRSFASTDATRRCTRTCHRRAQCGRSNVRSTRCRDGRLTRRSLRA